jgi:hypothetical protein
MDLSMIDLNSVIIVLAILLAVGLVFFVVRFFFAHLLHLLIRGCGVIVIVLALLAVLRYLKIF